MDTIDAIERIEHDFAQRKPPFNDTQFPEERLLENLPAKSMEDKLKAISFFATCDYNRNASQLVGNLLQMHDRQPHFYDAYENPPSENVIETTMEHIGFRYPSRDAHGWFKNNEILRNEYNGKWSELVMSCSCDAPTLRSRLVEDGFLYLKGDKLAPMYARIINDEVCPLSNLWELDIPTDVHIVRLTKDLADTDLDTKDDVRRWWRNIADDEGVNRHVVDGSLWLIGSNWDDWGEDYWNSVLSND